jgi:two-component system, chemotaxis family, protein-glutamate methylesterase/glutaminase
VTRVPQLRVLICEDSNLYAASLRRLLERDADIQVSAVCATAEEAIAALPGIRPDLVTMDIELPGMGGLEAVTEIMSSRPLPILVLSGHVGPGTEQAAAALAAGALDVIAKDDLNPLDPAGVAGVAFRQRVRLLSRARVIRHLSAKLSGGPDTSRLAHRASVIGVCASVGGPQVLATLLKPLPADYPIPILVVQHIAAGFTAGLVRWLDRTVAIAVGIAAEGARPAPGVWLAPENTHLMLARTGRLTLDRHTVAGHHRPSGDVLLNSVAVAAGKTGVAVVLTGMGSDGAAGAAAVRRRGGLAIAQDEESSAVFGMPKSAIDQGATVVLAPAAIAACLLGLEYQPPVDPW